MNAIRFLRLTFGRWSFADVSIFYLMLTNLNFVSMPSLPIETFAEIFCHLLYLDLLSAASVCRLWREIIMTEPSTRIMAFKPVDFDIGIHIQASYTLR